MKRRALSKNGERALLVEPPWWKAFLRTRYPLAKVHDYGEVLRLYKGVIDEGREWARKYFPKGR